ncbi:MAG: hypothetical protein H7841_05880 [Magnetospirillum sp. WYHS-4]
MERLIGITADQLREAMDKGPLKDLRCLVCKGEDMQAFVRPAYDPRDATDMAAQGTLCFPADLSQRNVGPWLVPITCLRCGYVMMFDSAILARQEPHEP